MNARKLFSLLILVVFSFGIADARMNRTKRMKKMTGVECVPCDMENLPVSEFYCADLGRTRALKPSDQPVMVKNDPTGNVYYCNEIDFKNYEMSQNRYRNAMEEHGENLNSMPFRAFSVQDQG